MKKEEAAGRRKIISVVLCMMAAGICYSCSCMGRGGLSSQTETRIVLGETGSEAGLEQESLSLESETVREEISNTPETETSQETDYFYVHVCGQVVSPGVYQLLKGSRVYEAVALAGGCTETGAPDWLNMAQEVTDGMKIQVPDQETVRRLIEEQSAEAELIQISGSAQEGSGRAEAQTSRAGALVNINTADKAQLMTLPGIGESRAEAIIQYREEYGGFQKPEDIMKVSGIKEAAFQKIKDSITV